MRLRVGMGIAAAVLVVTIVLIVSSDGDDGGNAAGGGGADSEQLFGTADGAVGNRDGSPVAPSEAELEQRREGAEAVEGVYGDLADAVAQKSVAPLTIDLRRGLEGAEEVESLQGICARMSKQAREQTVEYARVTARLSDVDWTCEKSVALLARRARQSRRGKAVRPVEVVGINVDGDRATATLDSGKGPRTTVPLVKEDGAWKLGTPPGGGR
ncbi:MAG TPA: hypothetical protein VEW67_09500 [Thermoleophilaceae bacterium]|nr:hypothetical protein [Thermoleophilaceae bacterium]